MPRAIALAVLALLAQPGLAHVAPPAPRRLAKAVLAEKIRGGWAGKMIGVSCGAPTEFQSNGAINEREITWSPERVSNALGQDDLYADPRSTGTTVSIAAAVVYRAR